MRKIFSFMLLGALFALGSCSKDEPDPSVGLPAEIAENGLTLSSTGQPNQIVTFKSNREWSVAVTAIGAGDISWLHVSPLSGTAGQASLTLYAEANPQTDARKAQVNIIIEGQTESFTVTQAQKDALILGNNQVTVPAEGDLFHVQVESNVELKVEIPQDYASWLSRIEKRSMASSTFTFKAEAYQGYENRLGKIVVKDLASTLSDTIYVTQKTSIALPTLYVKNAGGLDQALTEATQQRDTITTLVVLGRMNADDFQTLRNDLIDLKSIDLSATELQDNVLPADAFANHTSLTDIVLPDNLVEIGDKAFFNVKTLTCAMKLPQTVKRIGINAFYGTKIVSTWDDMLPGGLEELGTGAFANCRSITGKLNLPENITVIPAQAFCFSGVNELVLPDRITEIKEKAFQGLTSVSGMLEIPGSVKSLGNYAFAQSSFTGITMHEGLETIGEWVFYQCNKMAGKLILPNTVTSIGLRAFDNCSSLTGLRLSENLTTIPKQCFDYCRSMTGDLVIPAKTTFIDFAAFRYASFTGKLVIPATLDTLGGDVFDSNMFDSIEFEDGCKLTILDRDFVYCDELSGHIVVPEGITTVGHESFGRTSISSLTLPSTTTIMGNDVVYNCQKLQKLVCLATTPPTLVNYNRKVTTTFGLYGPKCPVYVPAEAVETYKATPGWNELTILALGSSAETDIPIDDMTNSEGEWK